MLLIDRRRHGALSREAAPLPAILSLLEITA
jgi:hypothetical protein